ncbi:MAG TPA: fumarylacetoacetate hydrolase family protein [Streptosporangiaceae bacterium]|jgi:2-keto-4-pentenoate hydratase/2-oxohepta-3-ene-1,7-dioic acid hydratase in catechol pathway|nr:fumarylacetoacetate hydrolase family protein [Streptosporangiaceae bacterium]
MQLISFTREGRIRSGGIEDVLTDASTARVVDLNAADPRLPADMLELLRGGDELLQLARHVIESAPSQMWLPLAGTQLVAPVPNPGKIICIGLNYRDHAGEAGLPIPAEPVVFAKLGNTVNGPYSPIPMPSGSEQIDYEGELGVVLGKTCKGVKEADALDYVAGYLAVNDVSARDVQHRNGQWVLGKSPDGFAPMGPALVTADEVGDPQQLDLRTRVGDELLQSSNTREMIFPVARLISFISEFVTLEPGDVIATGTPNGVGGARTPPRWLRAGETVRVEIPGLGALANLMVSPAG